MRSLSYRVEDGYDLFVFIYILESKHVKINALVFFYVSFFII